MKRRVTNRLFSSLFLVPLLGIALAAGVNGDAGATTISFDNGSYDNGSLTGGSTVIGSDIYIGTVSSSDGTSLTCQSCLLNFETASLTSSSGNTSEYGVGGSFSIVGTTPGVVSTSSDLLTGSFLDATLKTYGSAMVFTGTLDGSLNTLLAQYFGVSSQGAIFTYEISIENGKIADADVVYSPVPIPAALPLFGSAILGLGFMGRKRRRDSAYA